MFRYFKFRLNDTVQFAENDGHIYRIVGYRLEKGYDAEEDWTYVVYELLREFDGYQMDAEEQELVKIVQVEGEYYKIKDMYGYRYPVKARVTKKAAASAVAAPSIQQRIDELLDEYNDYRRLAALFGDLSYKQKADELLGRLKKMSSCS